MAFMGFHDLTATLIDTSAHFDHGRIDGQTAMVIGIITPTARAFP
jgi:hypothetical protein